MGRNVLCVCAVVLAACGESSTRLPTSPATGTSAAAVHTVSVRAITPQTGGTLAVHECALQDSDFGITRYCSDGLSLTIEARSERSMPEAAISIVFAAGSRACAYAHSEKKPVTAGQETLFTISSARLVNAEDLGPGECPLPFETTEIQVSLFGGGDLIPGGVVSSISRLVTAGFPLAYRFERP